MSLSDTLGQLFPGRSSIDAHLASGDRPLLRVGRLTDPEMLRRSARRVAELFDEPPEAPGRHRDAIVADIADRLRRNDWRDVRTSRVMMAARAAFDAERRSRADLEPLRAFLIEEWPVTYSAGLRSVMADVYLESFEPSAPHSRALAAALERVLPDLPDRWSRLFETLPELRDPEQGPARLARRMAAMNAPYEDLRDAGLRAPHGAGFMEHAHTAYIDRLAPRLAEADEKTAETLFGWLKPVGRDAPDRGAEQAMRALLVPWRERTPPERYRQLLMKRLLEVYKDPRTQSSGPWVALDRLDDTAKPVLLRWLVGATLEAFLDIVSEAEDSHMWEPRRKFWLDLHRYGHIQEAWVALSDEGQRIAGRRAREARDNALLSFGRQTVGGARSNTSLLILRVNGRIVVEGSHNYKIHIFRSDRPGCPSLYRRTYDCEDVRLSQPEHEAKSHLGDWQSWVRQRVT